MKKTAYFIFTILSLIGLITCIFLKGTHYTFNSSNVKNNIGYLSSTKFKGRLAGSKENDDAAKEIENLFKDYNLKPLGKDFREGFNVMTPVYTGKSSSLRITKGETIIKEYTLGEDFKEDMLNFKLSKAQFSKDDEHEIYQRTIVFHKNNLDYIFSVSPDKSFPFRSSFSYDSSYGFVVQITSDAFNEILKYISSGNTLDVTLPYEVKQTEIYNIAGMIKGTSSELPPLIITSHFDHVGTDSLGNIYSGALDNASGTAFMLELARTFSSLKTPKRDIIFVALNAEEFGLLGSKAFVNKHVDEFKGAEVINFDMVGAKDFPITFMEGSLNKDKDSKLYSSLESICTTKNISNTVVYQDSSDHASFSQEGFDALTITHADMSRIHTPNDTVDNISTLAISSVYGVVESKVINYAYNDISLIFYNSKTLIFFSLTTFLLIILGLASYKKNKSNAFISSN